MLLALDVGNTHIAIGIYQGEKLASFLRFHTDRQRTVDEYGVMLKSLLRDHGYALEDIEAVAISNVVPDLRHVLEELCPRYLKAPMLMVRADLDLGINIKTDNPLEVGADIIVAAVAAHTRHPGTPLLVADFGTATKISAVTAEGDFVGTTIAPGFAISAEAIYQRAPHLPRIKYVKPPSPIGTNTIHSMQSGLLLGHACMVDGLIDLMRQELQKRRPENGRAVKVLATGGLSAVVAPVCRFIDTVDQELVLEGIRVLYERNRTRVVAP